MSRTISPAVALKEYFGSDGYPEVTTKELLALRKGDAAGYTELASAAAAELGAELASAS